MIDEIMKRWNDLGKPLFMIPKDFKERLLLNMDSEIKLNYLVSSLFHLHSYLEMVDLRIRNRYAGDIESAHHLLQRGYWRKACG